MGPCVPDGLQARLENRTPVYFSFIDHLIPQGDGPAINGLDERRRGPAFERVLRAAADAGELPPVIMANKDISLPSTRYDERSVPSGATLIRLYLTQWCETRLGGFAVSEVQCRVFVEVVHAGRPVSKLGPYLGRTGYDMAEMTTSESRRLQFEAAARQAVDAMARGLRL